MINISEALARNAIINTPAGCRALANQLSSFKESLSGNMKINWDTGEVDFDTDNIRAAAEELQASTSYAVGVSFPDDLLSALESGMAIIDAGKQDAIPWALLKDPIVVSRLSTDRLQALGVSAASPETVQSEMRARFNGVPPLIDETVAASLIGALQERRLTATAESNQVRFANLLPRALPDKPGGDGDGGAGGGGAGGGAGGGGQSIITQVENFVGQCLRKITPTTPSLTVGPGLCFDEGCAKDLNAIILAGGAPELAKAGAAALTASSGGFSAALTAAVAAVGGWVTFIIVICAIVFSFWFESCITSRGACIHFPWWAGFGPIPFAR